MLNQTGIGGRPNAPQQDEVGTRVVQGYLEIIPGLNLKPFANGFGNHQLTALSDGRSHKV